MAEIKEDTVMAAARERFEASGMSLEALGLKMGYPKLSARKSAWQFLHGTSDPRLSMLRKFAGAIGIKVATLLRE
jgi:transcriptional regulator with XRE-family HTH domain